MASGALILALLHQSSVKYLDLALGAEDTTIAAKLTVAPSDLSEPLGLPADAQPTALAASTAAAARYVRDWVAIAGCTPGDALAAPDLDGRFVVVRWDLGCHGISDELDLDLARFFAIDPRHEAIVRVGREAPIVVRSTSPRWMIPINDDAPGHRWWLLVPGVAAVAGVGFLLNRRRRTVM
ncbi:hypothetical protein BH11MYX3_BH11MYX3_32090 [soil metagenome]